MEAYAPETYDAFRAVLSRRDPNGIADATR